MEVHHHPHAGKKNLKEYLLEGLMIFLAVSLGFFAESIRESVTDHERETAYMRSLVKDLEEDKHQIDDQQKEYEIKMNGLDSLIILLNASSVPAETNALYYFARLATKNIVFPANTRTIDQMKNAGGFRVIRNEQVVSDIMSYYAVLQQIKSLEDTELGENNEYRKIAVQIFNAVVFNEINSGIAVLRPVNNPPLRITDKKLAGDLSGWVHYIKNTRIGIYNYKKQALYFGEKLISEIRKEYRVDQE